MSHVFIHLANEEGGEMGIQATGCCALSQLRVIGPNWYPEEIESVLAEHGKSVKKDHNPRNGDSGGAPALFCVTTPNEERLADYLEETGWSAMFDFPRRKGYPDGDLTFWLKVFPRE